MGVKEWLTRGRRRRCSCRCRAGFRAARPPPAEPGAPTGRGAQTFGTRYRNGHARLCTRLRRSMTAGSLSSSATSLILSGAPAATARLSWT